MGWLAEWVTGGKAPEDGPEDPAREEQDLFDLGRIDVRQQVLPRTDGGIGIVVPERAMAVAAQRAAGGLEGCQQVLGPGKISAPGDQRRQRRALAAESPGGVAEPAQGQNDVVAKGLLDHLEARAGRLGEQARILRTAEQLAVVTPLEAEPGEVLPDPHAEVADLRREGVAVRH